MLGFDIAKTIGHLQHSIQDVVQSVRLHEVALNPQPLPPEPPDIFTRLPDVLADVLGRGGEVSLNPQPLPPGPADIFTRLPDVLADALGRGGEVSLNPQPSPPGPADIFSRLPDGLADLLGRGGEVSLNPQPLPPEPPELAFDPARFMQETGEIDPELPPLFPDVSAVSQPSEMSDLSWPATRFGEAVIDWDSIELPELGAGLSEQDFMLGEQGVLDPSAFGPNPVFEQQQF
jgi:hypothetical protein